MSDRSAQLSRFVCAAGWAPASLTMVAGDASPRKYYRVTNGSQTAIVMDASPELDQNVSSFSRIAMHLRSVGLSAPEIYCEDDDLGFLLLEDFGDAVVARLLETGAAGETQIYGAAMDVLIQLQSPESPRLEPMLPELMADMVMVCLEWYRLGAIGDNGPDLKAEWSRNLSHKFITLQNEPQVLVQRDFHAENLIWLPERTGTRRLGLLDFQDAVLGHPAYDVTSILQDARRDVDRDLAGRMLHRFISGSGLDTSVMENAFHLIGVQRNLRIIGVFARLAMRDKKAGYLGLIPRVWDHVQFSLSALGDKHLTDLINDALPRPAPDVLARIKDCAP